MEQDVNPIRRVAQALMLGVVLALPLFIAAALEANRDDQRAAVLFTQMAWLMGLSTYVLALPWMLALKPLLQIPVGESALWMQQLMLGISCLISIGINGFIALRWFRFERLLLIAAIISIVQCVAVVNT